MKMFEEETKLLLGGLCDYVEGDNLESLLKIAQDAEAVLNHREEQLKFERFTVESIRIEIFRQVAAEEKKREGEDIG